MYIWGIIYIKETCDFLHEIQMHNGEKKKLLKALYSNSDVMKSII